MSEEHDEGRLPKWVLERLAALRFEVQRLQTALNERPDPDTRIEWYIRAGSGKPLVTHIPSQSVISIQAGVGKVDLYLSNKNGEIVVQCDGELLVKPRASNSVYLTTG